MSSGQTQGLPEVDAELRGGTYSTKITEVEPGGAGFIPLAERRGKPLQLFWTWTSPNFEFATIFVGVIAVLYFNLNLWQAAAAIIVGTGLGSLTHGILSARGPQHGVPQMILSRISFGRWGNSLPAGLNAITAGIGWFAVNSVSGAFALNALVTRLEPTSWPQLNVKVSLLIIVVAQILISYFGYNLLTFFETWAFPLLCVVFVVASAIIFSKAQPSSIHPSTSGLSTSAGFTLALGAAFGYAVGWNPFASDYTRYFKPETSKMKTGLFAGLGIFFSCTLLELAGAAAVAIPSITSDGWNNNPTDAFVGALPKVLGDLTLLAIALGAIAANAINIYSGSISFLALPFTIGAKLRRAISALVFGAIGFVLAVYGLTHVSKYENFLLVVAYWIGPWLGVFFADQYLRRRHNVAGFLFDRAHNPWAGAVSMLAAMGISIWLFSNQTLYTGILAKKWSGLGDIGFEVGFVLAALFYVLFFSFQKNATDEALNIPATASL